MRRVTLSDGLVIAMAENTSVTNRDGAWLFYCFAYLQPVPMKRREDGVKHPMKNVIGLIYARYSSPTPTCAFS